jgi:hypothetical protein
VGSYMVVVMGSGREFGAICGSGDGTGEREGVWGSMWEW